MYEHALKKAAILGMPLMITRDETREGFFNQEAVKGKFTFSRYDASLSSHSSRAPKVYVGLTPVLGKAIIPLFAHPIG
jgi:hypothetical protein